MSHATLFSAPKQGGIVQSSGFLDLKSLMSLSETCKAHRLDELSLILLIENEITRHHGVQTMEEAIAFWRKVTCPSSLLGPWLSRNDWETGCQVPVSRNVLSDAVQYEVMFFKMLLAFSVSERLRMVSAPNELETTLLHDAVRVGNVESVEIILSLYPDESALLSALDMKDQCGMTVLHHAAEAGALESFKFILNRYPVSRHLQVVCVEDIIGRTVVHCAEESRSFECFKTVLTLYPDSERLRAVSKQDKLGRNVLHCAARSDNIYCIRTALALYPESQLQDTLHVQTRSGKSVLDLMCLETRTRIMEWLAKSEFQS